MLKNCLFGTYRASATGNYSAAIGSEHLPTIRNDSRPPQHLDVASLDAVPCNRSLPTNSAAKASITFGLAQELVEVPPSEMSGSYQASAAGGTAWAAPKLRMRATTRSEASDA